MANTRSEAQAGGSGEPPARIQTDESAARIQVTELPARAPTVEPRTRTPTGEVPAHAVDADAPVHAVDAGARGGKEAGAAEKGRGGEGGAGAREAERLRRDAEWLERIRCGDSGAFEQLFRAYVGVLNELAARYVPSPDDADDVVQTVFVNLWRNRSKLAIRGDVRSYLRRAVHNACLNALREGRAAVRHEGEWPEDVPGGSAVGEDPLDDEVLEREERKARCARLLAALPERARQVADMRFFGGMTREEIAAALGISPNTVKNHLAAVKRALCSGVGLEQEEGPAPVESPVALRKVSGA